MLLEKNYYKKYLKYKHKYKNQVGASNKDKKFIFNETNYLIIPAKDTISLEREINKLKTTESLNYERKTELGDLLYYNTIDQLDVSLEELNMLKDLYNEVLSGTSNVEQNLSSSDDIDYSLIDNAEIVPIISIRCIDEQNINRITSLDLMINLIDSRIGYFTSDLEFVKNRIDEIKNHIKGTIQEAIEVFNKEKKSEQTKYDEIKSIFSGFENYYTNNLQLENLSGTNYRKNMGKIMINSKQYMYKIFSTYFKNTIFHNLTDILNLYKFIINCNKSYFLKIYKNINKNKYYRVEFIKIPKIIIFTKNDIGYLMNFVEGVTVRDLIKNNNRYWLDNKELIKEAICNLIDNLTLKEILIIDFAYDNVMWDIDSNKLTYIDIQSNAFGRKTELDSNENVKVSVIYDKVY